MCPTSSSAPPGSHEIGETPSDHARDGRDHARVHPLVTPDGNLDYSRMYLLGHGVLGQVFVKNSMPTNDQVPMECMKVIPRAALTSKREQMMLERSIDIMRLLSKEEWQHENIMKFYNVYYLPTQVCILMECGGFQNLGERLAWRHGQERRPLSATQLTSVILQITSAVSHLHTHPRVCHRDIKPENIIVRNGDDNNISITLVDFDTAVRLKGGRCCQALCGSMPYAAPEMASMRGYNGFSADVWSVGILLFDVLCGIKAMPRILKLEAKFGKMNALAEVRQAMHDASRVLQSPASIADLLRTHTLPEAAQAAKALEVAVVGALSTDPIERWTASQVYEVAQSCQI